MERLKMPRNILVLLFLPCLLEAASTNPYPKNNTERAKLLRLRKLQDKLRRQKSVFSLSLASLHVDADSQGMAKEQESAEAEKRLMGQKQRVLQELFFLQLDTKLRTSKGIKRLLQNPKY